MNRPSIIIVAMLAAVISAAVALADTIYLKNGNKFEGKVIEETDTGVVLESHIGRLTFNHNVIDRIERGPSLIEQYEQALAELEDDDSVGHYYLGLWCKREGLRRQAEAQFKKVIEINPNHAEAREELGHVMHAGKWLTKEEAMQARGFELHGGRWVDRKEAEELRRDDKASALAEELRRAIRLLEGSRAEETRNLFAAIGRAEEPYSDKRVSIGALRSHSRHANPVVRFEIIKTLGALGTADAFDLLIEMVLNESDEAVFNEAVEHLKALNSKRAARALAASARTLCASIAVAQNNQKPQMVQAIARASAAMGKLGEPMVVPKLVDLLVIEVNYMREAGGHTFTGFTQSTTRTISIDRAGSRLPIEATSTSGVSVTSGTSHELIRFYQNEQAVDALRALTRQRHAYERRKWLEWWAGNKPVFPPEEWEFELE